MLELMLENEELDTRVLSLPANHELANLSDHINYWKFGYPAIYAGEAQNFQINFYGEQRLQLIKLKGAILMIGQNGKKKALST